MKAAATAAEPPRTFHVSAFLPWNRTYAMRLVAAELGNTPAICRKSYVHPIVVARYLDEGETVRLPERYRATPSAYAHSPEERALIRFLDQHFPERRRRTR